jgi:hypothetical protein
MTVKNIGNESQSYFGDNQKLKDSAGREYSADSAADLWMNEGIQTDISPVNQVNVNNGAKGTGLGVVEAIRKHAVPWFDEFTTSGLSTIEMVRTSKRCSGCSGTPQRR